MSVIRKRLKSGDVAYMVRVKDAKGEWYPSKTFDRKVDADVYETQLISERAKGARMLLGNKYTLKQYWDKWIEERGIELDPGWKKNKTAMFHNHIEPVLGSMLLTEIGKSDISRLMGILRDKGLSSSTRNHVHQILNPMFRDAIEFYDLLLVNPVRRDHRAKNIEKQRNFWKASESRQFLASVRDHRYGIAYWIMLWNGLRVGEVLGLRHGDIDLESGVIYVKRQWNKNQTIVKPLKNRREFIAEMPEPLIDFLKIKLPQNADPDSLVIRGKSGSHAMYKTVSLNLTKACKEAGLKRLTNHELRHSMTELWIEIGATEEDLKKLLNHKSPVSTRKYIHRTNDRLKMLAKKIRMTEEPWAAVVPLTRK